MAEAKTESNATAGIRNGMPANADELSKVKWIKSSKSAGNGNCAECAPLPGGGVASHFPTGPALVFTDAEWAAFIEGIEGGEFNFEAALLPTVS